MMEVCAGVGAQLERQGSFAMRFLVKMAKSMIAQNECAGETALRTMVMERIEFPECLNWTGRYRWGVWNRELKTST